MLLDIGFDEFVEYTVHRFSVAFARSAKQLLRSFGDVEPDRVIRFGGVAVFDRGGCFAHYTRFLSRMRATMEQQAAAARMTVEATPLINCAAIIPTVLSMSKIIVAFFMVML